MHILYMECIFRHAFPVNQELAGIARLSVQLAQGPSCLSPLSPFPVNSGFLCDRWGSELRVSGLYNRYSIQEAIPEVCLDEYGV